MSLSAEQIPLPRERVSTPTYSSRSLVALASAYGHLANQ